MFQFHLDLLAENQRTITFDSLLGQKVGVTLMLPADKERYFHGIISSFSQGGRDQRFTRYRAEMVPQLWQVQQYVSVCPWMLSAWWKRAD